MLTKMSQFYSVLAANRHGFTAKQPGTRKGTIRNGDESPAEVVYRVLNGAPAETVSTAAFRLFSSAKLRHLVTSAAEAPSLLYIYRRVFSSVRSASGDGAALQVEHEWQSILSVRGQMLKALGINDTLRGDDRLSGSLIAYGKEM